MFSLLHSLGLGIAKKLISYIVSPTFGLLLVVRVYDSDDRCNVGCGKLVHFCMRFGLNIEHSC